LVQLEISGKNGVAEGNLSPEQEDLEALETLPLDDLLRWIWERFGNRAAIGTSFQGAGIVMLHAATTLKLPFPVFTLDTDLLFPETLELKATLESRLGLAVESVRSETTLSDQARELGPALWARDPDTCCLIRKVLPLRRKLSTLDAWISGVRREQSSARSSTRVVERHLFDPSNGRYVFKIHPLAAWSRSQVQEYLRRHGLPQNPLLERGFRSIGCQPCTRPVGTETADDRAGRWTGFDKTECGIHTFLGENI
jgi:phosphoadenosine phosphosulfate reductase